MFNFVRRVVKGCGYLPGYGWHPGTSVAISLVIIGALAGVTSKSPDKIYRAFLGAGFMSVYILPLYFYGAYERAKDYDNDLKSKPPLN